ncbi:UDP-glycosyltransferase 83A1 [Acorus calamus]|uniref:UDP-glycosyltransferase 83A1 n=1 Tax=Acorus calamus TaxID=4465 RepID=A0AAV9E7Z8_ACOCL|nr:UDP-glycosyltransferase 83A1 [Acorus calamus]
MGSLPSPPLPPPPPPHALVLHFQAQGHVIPLMEPSHRLVDRGFSITFVNTDFDHASVVASLPGPTRPLLRLVSIPDGLVPEADRNNLERPHSFPLMEASLISFIIINKRVAFDYTTRGNKSIDTSAEWVLCNFFSHVESPVFKYAPKICPIGPRLSGIRPSKPVGRYWPEDSSCEEWLSVVYVAFGSFTIFDPRQFKELGLGLEMMGRRFLWVVRPDLTKKANMAFSEEFEERVTGRGRMVGWSPQQRVLTHPSVVCFMSHCGWNSIMEGVTNGLPFLCWPYFADQFLNESYICDLWKVGLKLNKDAEGMVTKEEIGAKVEALLGDGEVVGRALELKEIAAMSIAKGGSSCDNFNEFVESMKKVA